MTREAARIRQGKDRRLDQAGGLFAMLAKCFAPGVSQKAIQGEIRGERFLAGFGCFSRFEIFFRVQAHYLPHYPRVIHAGTH